MSYPQKSENVRPHYSQSSRENATASSGTSHQPLIRKYPLPVLTALSSTELHAKRLADSQPPEDEAGRFHVKKVVMLAGEN